MKGEFKDIIEVKQGNYTYGYVRYFKEEWNRITSKLKRYPQLKNVPLVPDDRSHERIKHVII